MNELTLLSLIQKYRRDLHSYSGFRQQVLQNQNDCEEWLRYLEQQERDFFLKYCENKSLWKEKQEFLLKLKLQGVAFSYPGEALYPKNFDQTSDPPLFFSYRGHPAWIYERSLAVVGSRDSGSLSNSWMEEYFSEFLKTVRPVVVSGGARGIDQLAHRLAIRNGCPTVVVVPSGLGVLYPHSLKDYERKIVEGGGCLMSEYPHTEVMNKYFFHDRNRLIAALGVATLLVEARRRSGSLLTAQKTAQLGKPVLVIPGHPSEGEFLGNLDLLCDGAVPIRNADDLTSFFRSELNYPSLDFPIGSQINSAISLAVGKINT